MLKHNINICSVLTVPHGSDLSFLHEQSHRHAVRLWIQSCVQSPVLYFIFEPADGFITPAHIVYRIYLIGTSLAYYRQNI